MHCTGLHTVGFWPKTSGWSKEPITTSRPALLTFVKAMLQPPANLQKTRKMLIYQSVTSPTLQESTAYDSVLSGSPPDVKSVHQSKTSWEENHGLLYCRSIETGDVCTYLCCLSLLLSLSISRKRTDITVGNNPSCALRSPHTEELMSLFTHPHEFFKEFLHSTFSTKVYRDHICVSLWNTDTFMVFYCVSLPCF